MKKVVSLALAAAMAVGMSISSFAAVDLNNIKGFDTGKNLADGVTSIPSGASLNNQVLDLGDRYAMDEFEMDINLRTALFGGNNANVVNETVYYALDVANFRSNDYLFTEVQAGNNPGSWAQVEQILRDAEAASPTQINVTYVNDIEDYIRQNTTNDQTHKDLLKAYQAIGLVKELSTGTQNALYFTDKTGAVMSGVKTGLSDRNLTADEIRKSKITVGTTMKANSNTIKEIKLVNKDGKITFKLVDEWVSTTDKDFEAIIYLQFNGKRADSQHLTVIGNMSNPELDVYADHDHADIHRGYVINPVEFNSKIAVDIGNGVTIHTKLFKDKKYYGITNRDNDASAERVFQQYKDVDNVITLKTIGFNNTSDYVTLSTDYFGYYVYDKDMNYLGRGDEQLDFSTKYYLANSKLDIEDEDEVDEDEFDVPTTGGDGSAAGNVNANPGTGR